MQERFVESAEVVIKAALRVFLKWAQAIQPDSSPEIRAVLHRWDGMRYEPQNT